MCQQFSLNARGCPILALPYCSHSLSDNLRQCVISSHQQSAQLEGSLADPTRKSFRTHRGRTDQQSFEAAVGESKFNIKPQNLGGDRRSLHVLHCSTLSSTCLGTGPYLDFVIRANFFVRARLLPRCRLVGRIELDRTWKGSINVLPVRCLLVVLCVGLAGRHKENGSASRPDSSQTVFPALPGRRRPSNERSSIGLL